MILSSHVVQFDIDLTAFDRRRGELVDTERLIPADLEMIQAAAEAFDRVTEANDAPLTMMVGTIC